MYVAFKHLSAINCFSYKQLSLDFEDGINIIEGWNVDGNTSNGSGKSSIADILCWTIYGVSPRGVKNNDVIYRGDTKASATVILQDDRNNTYKIIRTLGPHTLKLWVNDRQITKENITAMQRHIAATLGIPYEMFIRSVYFPQNYSWRFLYLTAEERKDMIYKLMKLDHFDRLHELAKSKNREAGIEIDMANAKTVKLIQTVKELKLAYTTYLFKSQNQKDVIAKELKDIDKEIADVDSELARCIANIKDKKLTFKSLPSSQDSFSVEYANRKELLKKLEAMGKQRDVLQTELSFLYNKKDSLERKLHDTLTQERRCSMCGQTLNDQHIAKINRTIGAELDPLNISIKEAEDKIIKIESTYNKHHKRIIDEIAEFDGSLERGSDLNRDIRNLENTQKLLEERKNGLLKLRGKTLTSENSAAELAERTKEQLVKAVDELNTITTTLREQKKNQKVYAEVAKTMGPQGIRAMIMDNIIDELNAVIKDYMTVLYDQNVDLIFKIVAHETPARGVSYKIEDTLTLKNEEWSFNSLSGGEKRRATIAVDLALAYIMSRRYGNGCNLLILDEVTTDLDEYSRNKFYNLLEQFCVDDKAIYMIDHSIDKLGIRGAKSIKVTKIDGVSTLKYVQN